MVPCANRNAIKFIQTFFVSALSGTITSELANILNDPEQIVTLLANSLPAQSSYFIQVSIMSTLVAFSQPHSHIASDLPCFHVPSSWIGFGTCVPAHYGFLSSICLRPKIDGKGTTKDMERVQLTRRSSRFLAC